MLKKVKKNLLYNLNVCVLLNSLHELFKWLQQLLNRSKESIIIMLNSSYAVVDTVALPFDSELKPNCRKLILQLLFVIIIKQSCKLFVLFENNLLCLWLCLFYKKKCMKSRNKNVIIFY